MAAILNLAILDSGILVYPLKLTHTCQDWVPPFAQKKLHSHYPPSFTIWLKLIQSDWNYFILTQLDDGSHLEFCQLEFGHPGFRNLNLSSQTHSYLPRLGPTICTKKNFYTLPSPPFAQKNFPHSFRLKLLMVVILISAILNSAILDSASALWNSDILFSSLRLTQKHSHSTLTLTQTNSIWLKLIHSDSTWWWQPSWIPPSWIQES